MDSELWATIRRLYEAGKLSKSAIARRLNVHRGTVRRALKSAGGPPADGRGGRVGRPRKLDGYLGYIQERVAKYPELTRARLLKEIRGHGYTGGKTILGEYLQEIHPRRALKAFLRLETRRGSLPRWTGPMSAPLRLATPRYRVTKKRQKTLALDELTDKK